MRNTVKMLLRHGSSVSAFPKELVVKRKGKVRRRRKEACLRFPFTPVH